MSTSDYMELQIMHKPTSGGPARTTAKHATFSLRFRPESAQRPRLFAQNEHPARPVLYWMGVQVRSSGTHGVDFAHDTKKVGSGGSMSSSDGWGFVLSIAAAVVLFGLCGHGLWYSRLAYKLYYSVSDGHLAIDKEPHDCDFWKAPIGEKECHYKRIVSTVEIGKGATDNTPVMSLDGGKTWSYFTPDPGITVPHDATVTSVCVSWQRIED